MPAVLARFDPRRMPVTQLVVAAAIPSFGAALLELLLVEAGPGASLPGLKTALEGVQAMIALLVAFLLYGRLQRSHSASDGLLLAGFLVLASNSVLVVVDLVVTPGTAPADGTVWGRVLLRLVGAALVTAAAWVPSWRPVGRLAPAIVAGAAAAVAAAVVLTIAEDHLPAAVHLSQGSVARTVPLVRAFLVLQLLLMVGATLGFLRIAQDAGDNLAAALAVGFTINSASFVAFLGRPSLYSDHVHFGDVLRVLFWVTVLIGAAAEVSAFWRTERDLAVLDERHRVARELHDGLAQELAYIAQQAQLLAEGDAPEWALEHVLASSQRALDEARRAIAVLRDSGPEELDELFREAAEDVAARLGVSVDVAVAPSLDLDPDVRETVVRIMREAVSNAARHGRARVVHVTLDDSGLRVRDEGIGFAVDDVVPGHFGIITMRERAVGIGAGFSLRSEPGRGTSVEVDLRP